WALNTCKGGERRGKEAPLSLALSPLVPRGERERVDWENSFIKRKLFRIIIEFTLLYLLFLLRHAFEIVLNQLSILLHDAFASAARHFQVGVLRGGDFFDAGGDRFWLFGRRLGLAIAAPPAFAEGVFLQRIRAENGDLRLPAAVPGTAAQPGPKWVAQALTGAGVEAF